MHILVAVKDIIDYSRISALAKQFGIDTHSLEQRKDKPVAIVVDLSEQSIGHIANKFGDATIIGFYPHVRKDLKEEAIKHLPMENVVPRSLLEQRLREFFTTHRQFL